MLQKHRGPQLFEAPVETKEIDISEKFFLKGEEVTATAEQLNAAGTGGGGGTVASEAMVPVVQAETVDAALALLGGATSASVALKADQSEVDTLATTVGTFEADIEALQATAREAVTAKLLYVATTGNDETGDGTEATPFATIQRALDWAMVKYNAYKSYIHIMVAPGTYTDGFFVVGTPDGCGANIRVIGDETTPSNVVISTTGICCSGYQGSNISLRGMKLQSSGGSAITGWPGSAIYWQNVDFGACPNGWHAITQNGYLGATGNYSISGSARGNLHAYCGGSINTAGKTVTLTGTPAFSYNFIAAYNCSEAACWSMTFVGSATGQRYYAYNNGTINVGGGSSTYFPGSVAGVLASGGTYA